MKNILIFSLLINTVPMAWGNCSKVDEYNQTIQTLEDDVITLRQKRDTIFSDEHFSEMYQILVDTDNSMTGTNYLQEQDSWQEKADDIEEKKAKTLKGSILPISLLLFTIGINYHLYKYPLSTAPVFSEEFLRPINGRILSRSIAAVFLLYATGQTAWQFYKYHNFSRDVKEAQSKIDILGKIADIEDTIKRKERMITHNEIQLQLLAPSCAHGLQKSQ